MLEFEVLESRVGTQTGTPIQQTTGQSHADSLKHKTPFFTMLSGTEIVT